MVSGVATTWAGIKKEGTVSNWSNDLYTRAKKVIPGASQLYSKRRELYHPSNWPAYFQEAKGAYVIADDKRYLDFTSNGLGACTLGYANQYVDCRVKAAINRGSASTLNTEEEVEFAERLLALHPWADMCKFTRSGGEAIAVTLRISEAYLGPECWGVYHPAQDYHGWHINNPLTGERYQPVDPDTSLINPLCPDLSRDSRINIWDEITTGFRFNNGGLHLIHDEEPHMAVFAKALGNGYPIAAVIGKRDVMMAAEDTFISSTSWSERTGFAAGLAVLDFYRNTNIPRHLRQIGLLVQDGVRELSVKHSVPIEVSGEPQLTHFKFESADVYTVYVQEMLKNHILACGDFYPTYAHTSHEVDRFLDSLDAVLRRIYTTKLEGPPATYGIKR